MSILTGPWHYFRGSIVTPTVTTVAPLNFPQENMTVTKYPSTQNIQP